jgi:hypothetical protein
MTDEPSVITFALKARTARIDTFVRLCAEKKITFERCCQKIAEMGYKTTSVYEMVRAAERRIRND